MCKMRREDKTIEQFCARLAEIEQQKVEVIERPDRDNPEKGGCDAIIDRGGQRMALEHRTIDSYYGQRADTARFKQVIAPLEQSIRFCYPELWIEIAVPANAIPTGTNWEELAGTLCGYCKKAISKLPTDGRLHKVTFQDIPFPLWISKDEGRYSRGCYVARVSPENLNAHLEDNIACALREKCKQLAVYRAQGLPTLLLLDSDDIALVNHHSLAEAFRRASGRETTNELDEVFIAEASRDPIWFFPVKINNRIYPDLPEFNYFFEEQYFLSYGERR